MGVGGSHTLYIFKYIFSKKASVAVTKLSKGSMAQKRKKKKLKNPCYSAVT